MAFPFAAVGAGIGNAAQQYRQDQDAQQRSQMLRLYLDNQRKQQQAAQLLGGLDLGALYGDKGPGGIAGLANLGGGPPQLGGPAGGPAPGPIPGASPMPQPAMPAMPAGDPMTGGRPTGVLPLDQSPASDVAADVAAESRGLPVLDFDAEQQRAAGAQAPANPSPPESPSAAADPGGGQPAGGQSTGDTAAGGGSLVATMAGGGQVPLDQLLGKHVSLGDVVSFIRKARPDAQGEVAWLAAERLYKLTQSDNKVEQSMAGQLLRYAGLIKNLDVKKEIASNQITAADNRLDKRLQTTERGQNIVSADKGAARATAERGQDIASTDRGLNRDVRQSEGAANRQAAMDRTITRITAQAQKVTAITPQARAQIRALDAQRRMIKDRGSMGIVSDEADLAALAKLNQQIVDIWNGERKRLGLPPETGNQGGP